MTGREPKKAASGPTKSPAAGGSFDFRLNNFDTLRLLAALQVVVIHGYEHLGLDVTIAPISFLERFPGVPIFFAISGFLISASWERSGELYPYFRNRFLRIYPGLWVCFAVSFLSWLVIFQPDRIPGEAIPWILGQLSIVQFYNPEFMRSYGTGVLNGSLWTIPVELQFYLLLPLLYIAGKRVRHPVRVALLAFVLAVAANRVLVMANVDGESVFTKLYAVTVTPYLYLFFIGIALQKYRNVVARLLVGRGLEWLAAYILVSIGLSAAGFDARGNDLNPLAAGMLSVLTISAAYTLPGKVDRLLAGNDISYGVYIYHVVVINAMIFWGLVGHPVYLILTTAISCVLAFLSWRFVERPALALKSYSIRSALSAK